ncbi:MAG: hypothetical protein Q8N78_10515, partial [Sulfurimonas sp.]|nr:hypothetical protein [Sulfurimonas sp.]
MRFFYYLLTIPFIAIEKIIFSFNIFDMRNNLKKCIQVVDIKCSEIPDLFTIYLIAAEDHRSQ